MKRVENVAQKWSPCIFTVCVLFQVQSKEITHSAPLLCFESASGSFSFFFFCKLIWLLFFLFLTAWSLMIFCFSWKKKWEKKINWHGTYRQDVLTFVRTHTDICWCWPRLNVREGGPKTDLQTAKSKVMIKFYKRKEEEKSMGYIIRKIAEREEINGHKIINRQYVPCPKEG